MPNIVDRNKLTNELTDETLSAQNTNNTILLVEDNLLNCEVTVDMLEMLGMSVDLAHNGQQAVDLFEKNSYGLILMDCEMPVMNGYAASKLIRDRENSRAGQTKLPNFVPIIALTAHTMSSIKEQYSRCGMNDLLSKPFQLADLQSLLVKWLNTNDGNRDVAQVHMIDKAIAAKIMTTESEICINEDVLNFEIINKFYVKQKKNNSNLLTKLITLYLQQSSGLLKQLKQASADNDLESLRIIAHTLKSSSENMGALKLAEVCRCVEIKCDKGHIDFDLVEDVFLGYRPVNDELTTLLDTLV